MLKKSIVMLKKHFYSEICDEDMRYVNNKGHGRGRIELGREGCARGGGVEGWGGGVGGARRGMISYYMISYHTISYDFRSYHMI